MEEYKLPMLPPSVEWETKHVLKALARANRALAELKGYADTIPNKHILINAVTINEAKDSSAIENIITTHSVKIVDLAWDMIGRKVGRLESWKVGRGISWKG